MATVYDLLPADQQARFPTDSLTPEAKQWLSTPVPDSYPADRRAKLAQSVLGVMPKLTGAYKAITGINKQHPAELSPAQSIAAASAAAQSDYDALPLSAKMNRQIVQGFEDSAPSLDAAPPQSAPQPSGFWQGAARVAGGAAAFVPTATAATAAATLAAPTAPLWVPAALGMAATGGLSAGTPKQRIAREWAGALMSPVSGAAEIAAPGVAAALRGAVAQGSVWGLGQPAAEHIIEQVTPGAKPAPMTAADFGRGFTDMFVMSLITHGLPNGWRAARRAVSGAEGVTPGVPSQPTPAPAPAAPTDAPATLSMPRPDIGMFASAGTKDGPGAAPRIALDPEGINANANAKIQARQGELADNLRALRDQLEPRNMAARLALRKQIGDLEAEHAQGVAALNRPGVVEPPPPAMPQGPAATPIPTETLEPARDAVYGHAADAAQGSNPAAASALRAAQENIRQPDVPPGTDPRLIASGEHTAQNVLGMFHDLHRSGENISMKLPDGTSLPNARIADMRVYPWAENPVRVTVQDVDTGALHPAAYSSLTQMNDAWERQSPKETSQRKAGAAVDELRQLRAAPDPRNRADGIARRQRIADLEGVVAQHVKNYGGGAESAPPSEQPAARGPESTGTEPVAPAAAAETPKPEEPPAPKPIEAPPAPAPAPPRDFGEAFTQAWRNRAQGATPEDVARAAAEKSGSEPPEGFDAAGEGRKVTSKMLSDAGQGDMFAGAATPKAEAPKAAPKVEEPAAPKTQEAVGGASDLVRDDSRIKAGAVDSSTLNFHESFQKNRDIERMGGFVDKNSIQSFLRADQGYSPDRTAQDPVLWWTDKKGEIGPEGKRYVLDGHHRVHLAGNEWKKVGEDYVSHGPMRRELPGNELHGTHAEAEAVAENANRKGVRNTPLEDVAAVGRALKAGKDAQAIADEMRLKQGTVKKYADLSVLDKGVLDTFFADRNGEPALDYGFGAALGAATRAHPDYFTPEVQRAEMSRAKDGRFKTAAEYRDVLKTTTDVLDAAKQSDMFKDTKFSGTLPAKITEAALGAWREIKKRKAWLISMTNKVKEMSDLSDSKKDAARMIRKMQPRIQAAIALEKAYSVTAIRDRILKGMEAGVPPEKTISDIQAETQKALANVGADAQAHSYVSTARGMLRDGGAAALRENRAFIDKALRVEKVVQSGADEDDVARALLPGEPRFNESREPTAAEKAQAKGEMWPDAPTKPVLPKDTKGLPEASVPGQAAQTPTWRDRAGNAVQFTNDHIKELVDFLNPSHAATGINMDGLHEVKGNQERNLWHFEQATNGMRGFFDSMKPEQEWHFHDAMQAGDMNAIPRSLRPVARAFREAYDNDHAAASHYKEGVPFLDNFMAQFYKADEKSKAFFNGRRGFEGDKRFMKERFYQTKRAAMDAGLTPMFTNPVDELIHYHQGVTNFLFAQELKRRGTAGDIAFRRVPLGSDAPEGWVRVAGADEFLNPVKKVAEYHDPGLMQPMRDVMAAIGAKADRRMNIGGKGRLGYSRATPGSAGEMVTKFGTPESVTAHELGHAIDSKFAMADFFSRGKGKVTGPELRKLADLRYEGKSVPSSFKDYVRQTPEKMAVMLEAFVHAPERFKEVAPNAYESFKQFLGMHDELKPLLNMKRTLTLEKSEGEVHAGGAVVGAHWYAPNDFARVLNNHFSPDFVRTSKIGKTVMAINHALVGVRLGISAFHATLMTQVAAAQAAANSAGQIESSLRAGDVGGAAVNTAKAGTFALLPGLNALAATAKYIREGKALMRGAGVDQEFIESNAFAGGMSLRNKQYYNSPALDSFLANVRRTVAGRDPASSAAKAALLAAPALLEAPMRFIHTQMVQPMKFSAFADEFRTELMRRHDDLAAGRTTETELARRTWNNIEDRFGLVNYDNYHMHRALQATLQVLMTAPGWKLGSMRAGVGAVVDVAKGVQATGMALMGKGGGEMPDFNTPRIRFALTIMTSTIVSGGLSHWLHTGQIPQTLKDYTDPKNGLKDARGHDQRVRMRGYLNEWRGWTNDMHGDAFDHAGAVAKEALGRVSNRGQNVYGVGGALSPVVTTPVQLLFNIGYNGPLYNPGDPEYKKVADVMKYFVTEGSPMTVQQAMKNKSEGASPARSAESFLGLTTGAPVDKTAPPKRSKTRNWSPGQKLGRY